MAAAEGRHQRKQRAERKEHDASHHRHVITRDRKHMGKADTYMASFTGV
jgi:hypothetical protein